jgi:hypothetical protein
MLFDANDVPYYNAAELRGRRSDAIDFKASHRQGLDEFGSRHAGIDKLT